MNDTFSDKPVTFEWTYTLGGKRIAGERKELKITPGYGAEQTLAITPPAVTERVDGTLTLKVSQEGAPDYVDERLVPTLPQVTSLETDAPLLVFDRSDRVAPFLKAAGAKFETIAELAALEKGKKSGLLIVGPDTLTPDEAFGSDLLKFAARGNQVVCLEQNHPPAGANLAAPLRLTTHFAGYAHPQAIGTPVFRDLGPKDLIDWAGDAPVCKNVYVKPTSGGTSLAHCGPELPWSCLVEMGAGQGMLLLCQLRVGAKLGVDPAADILLRNFIEHYAGRRPSTLMAAVYCPDDPLLADKVVETGALAETVPDIAAALEAKKYRAAVIDATAANLEQLAGLKEQAEAFQTAGGWITLCNLRPESLDAFNRLMDTRHMLRPFRIERVVLESPYHPLAATLTDQNVSYLSNKVQQKSRGAIWASWNTFTWCLDGRDVAPFTLPPGAPDDPMKYTPTWQDRDPYNWVNGMMRADHWRYIRQIWVVREGGKDPQGKPGPIGLDHTFRLQRPETIGQINIWNNTTYSTITRLDIVFDGDEENAVQTTLPAEQDGLQEVVLAEPRKVEKTVTLRIRDWVTPPHKHPHASFLVGLANVAFLRAEPPAGTPLDSAGGLVAFDRGRGGVFVSQIKFMKDEPNRENAPKKVSLLGTILSNMGVGTRSTIVAVPGVNIRFKPLNITDQCTTYRADHERKDGWFRGDPDLGALAKGENYLADIPFHVVDYATAPVPDCIVLRMGREGPHVVRGMKLGQKADVLYFLQAADVRRPITDQERARMHDKKRPFKLPEIAHYTLNYEDGRSVDIPVVLERHVDHWLQEKPKAVPGAVVAWDAPAPGPAEGKRMVLYAMKVDNPRPDVPISTIDVRIEGTEVTLRDGKKVYRTQNRAEFGLLAITAGTIVK
jgi:hypothetical protein